MNALMFVQFIGVAVLTLCIRDVIVPEFSRLKQKSPQFEAGNCIAPLDAETWEVNEIEKIVEVGKTKYRIKYIIYEYSDRIVTNERRGSVSDFKYIDEYFKKVVCPDKFKSM